MCEAGPGGGGQSGNPEQAAEDAAAGASGNAQGASSDANGGRGSQVSPGKTAMGATSNANAPGSISHGTNLGGNNAPSGGSKGFGPSGFHPSQSAFGLSAPMAARRASLGAGQAARTGAGFIGAPAVTGAAPRGFFGNMFAGNFGDAFGSIPGSVANSFGFHTTHKFDGLGNPSVPSLGFDVSRAPGLTALAGAINPALGLAHSFGSNLANGNLVGAGLQGLGTAAAAALPGAPIVNMLAAIDAANNFANFVSDGRKNIDTALGTKTSPLVNTNITLTERAN